MMKHASRSITYSIRLHVIIYVRGCIAPPRIEVLIEEVLEPTLLMRLITLSALAESTLEVPKPRSVWLLATRARLM